MLFKLSTEPGGTGIVGRVLRCAWPVDISRDGKLLLLTKHESFEQTWSLWIFNATTAAWRKLAEGGGTRTTAVFSSGNARVVFASDRDGGEFANLYSIDTDGATGSERRLLPPQPFGQFPQSASACGDIAYLEGVHSMTNTEVWVLPANGNPLLFVGGPGWKRHPAFSPDCHWLAYNNDASGHGEV